MGRSWVCFKEKKTETSPEVSETESIQIAFKVQIASSHIELDNSNPIFQGQQGVEVYISNGQFKYTIGNFKTAEEAHEKKRSLRESGFNGAFVAAFRDGKRIPMSEIPK